MLGCMLSQPTLRILQVDAMEGRATNDLRWRDITDGAGRAAPFQTFEFRQQNTDEEMLKNLGDDL